MDQLAALRGEQGIGGLVARDRGDEDLAPSAIMPLASKGCCLGGRFESFGFTLIEGLEVGLLTGDKLLVVKCLQRLRR